MLLTASGPEVYVATMITVLSDSYDSLAETLNHMKSLKLKNHQGENVTYFCDAILVYPEEPLIPSTLDISFASLRILLTLDSVSGRLISTRILWSLLRNFVCVAKI